MDDDIDSLLAPMEEQNSYELEAFYIVAIFFIILAIVILIMWYLKQRKKTF